MARGKRSNSYYVSIAAEAVAAAVFARARCDVSVQYGANQPEYDLVVARNGRLRKVSVKGSEDGGWVLLADHKKPDLDYHQAAAAWLQCHTDPEILYCFVQFRGSALMEMPRIYFATCQEVADYLPRSRAGHGYSSVRERHAWAGGIANGSIDEIPRTWALNETRIDQLIDGACLATQT